MISNLDELEFKQGEQQGGENLSTPRDGELISENKRADAPVKELEAEAAERKWTFQEAIAQEELKIQEARLTQMRLEVAAMEMSNRERAAEIRERAIACKARERDIANAEEYTDDAEQGSKMRSPDTSKKDKLEKAAVEHHDNYEGGYSDYDDARSERSTTKEKKGGNVVIKKIMAELSDNILTSNEVGKGLEYVRLIQRLAKFGGDVNPLYFISAGRLQMYEEYYNEFIRPYEKEQVLCIDRYEDMPDVAETFAKHFVRSIVHQRKLTEEDFLKHAYMEATSEFDSAKIEDYLGVVQADIIMLPEFSESSKVVQIMEGLQPTPFRRMILMRYPHIVSMTEVKGAIAIIRSASQKEQQTIDARKAGWGNYGKVTSMPTKTTDMRKQKNGKMAASIFRARDTKCSNCGDSEHHISDCTSKCTKCPPPHCGKVPSQCPRYLAWVKGRGARKNDDLKASHTETYDGRRSRRKDSRTAAVRKYYSYHDEPIAENYDNYSNTDREKPRPTMMTAPMGEEISTLGDTENVTHVKSRPKKKVTFQQDDTFLVDFGANGNFINSETAFDTDSITSITDTQVFMPDESGANSEATGTFCGEKAHLLPNFDKSLLCSEFFTNQHCAVLAIEDSLYVLKLDSSVLNALSGLIANSELTGDMLLNIQRCNGLYATSEKAIRKAFKKAKSDKASPRHDLSANASYFTAKLSDVEEIVKFWHVNLGHASKENMMTIVENNLIDGLGDEVTVAQISKYFPECADCIHGNMAQKRHPKQANRVYEIGKTLAIDVFEAGSELLRDTDLDSNGKANGKKSKILTHSGEAYAVICYDRGCGRSWIFLTATLSKMLEFIQRMDRIYTLALYELEELQIDAAFYTEDIRKYCEERRPAPIKPMVTAPHEHAQNGAGEAIVKIFRQGLMKQLHAAGLDNSWWGDCAHWFNDCRIRGPCLHDPEKSIAEAWDGSRIDIHDTPMMPFGSRVKAHIPLKLQDMGTTRCSDAIYIGRAVDHKGSIMLRHLDTMKVIVRYSFKVLGQRQIEGASQVPIVEIETSDDDTQPELHYNHLTGTVSTRKVADILQQDGSKYRRVTKTQLNKNQQHYFEKMGHHFVDGSTGIAYKIVGIDLQESHKGKKSKFSKTPLYKHYDTGLHDFPPRDDGDYEWISCAELLRDPETEWDAQRNAYEAHSATVCHDYLAAAIENDLTGELQCYNGLLRRLYASRAAVSDILPPKKFADLATHPEGPGYLKSFHEEVQSFKDNGMCLPPDIDIKDIPPELIMQLMPLWHKKYEGLDFLKFKCRIVGLGQHWKNIYGEATTSGMAHMDTIKTFLAVAAATGRILSKVDQKTAYLQAKLGPNDKTYYLRSPPGVPESIMPKIMQPSAYVYGHPKAGRQHEKKYSAFLLSQGWIRSSYDRYSYSLSNDIGKACLLTIVDDSPIQSTSIAMRDFVHASIGSAFKITIDNDVKHVAGLDVQQNDNNTYTLRQDGHCVDFFDTWVPNWRDIPLEDLPDTPMSSVSRTNPLSVAQQARANMKCDLKQITDVQSQLGSLNWLTHTWPDILFSYKDKSSCATKATMHDIQELQRIIRFMVKMYRTNDYGLTIGGTAGVQLFGTVDTSFASHKDLKSHTGGTVHMGPQYGSFLSFSAKQSLAVDSSASAEGVGSHMHNKIFLPLRYYLGDLFCPQTTPSRLCMDNVPYMQSALGEKGHSKHNRHVLIRMKITNDALENGEITLEHLNTVDMVADILTKPLGPTDFHRLRRVLLGMDPVQAPKEYIRDPKLFCH